MCVCIYIHTHTYIYSDVFLTADDFMTSDDDDELSRTASASSSVELAYKSPEHLQHTGDFSTPEEAAKGPLSLELSARCSLSVSLYALSLG